MTFEQGPVEMSQTLSFGGEICSSTQTTNVIEYQTTLCPTVQSEFEFSILNPVQNPVSNKFHEIKFHVVFKYKVDISHDCFNALIADTSIHGPSFRRTESRNGHDVTGLCG